MNSNSLIIFESNKIKSKYISTHFISKHKNSIIIVLEENDNKNNHFNNIKYISDYHDSKRLLLNADGICSKMLKNMNNNNILREAFTINGIYYLQLYRDGLGDILFNIIMRVLIIQRIIDIEKPSSIRVFEEGKLLEPNIKIFYSDIITEIIKDHNIVFINMTNKKAFLFTRFKTVFLMGLLYIYNHILYIKNLLLSISFHQGHNSESLNNNILFIPYCSSPIIYFNPIIKKLSKYKNYNIKAITYPWDNKRKIRIDNKEIDINPLNLYVNKKILKVPIKISATIKQWNNNKFIFYQSPIFIFNKINVANIIMNKFNVNYLYWLIKIHYFLYYAEEMIVSEKPSLLIVAKSRESLMRCILEMSKIHKIPSLYIQHGIYVNSWLWDSFNVTRLCIDEDFYKILSERGYNLNSIILTGTPRYDILYNKIENIKKIYKLKDNKKQVCFLPSSLPEWLTKENKKSLLKTLILAAQKFNFKLVIKLHPNESKDETDHIIRSLDIMTKKIHVSILTHQEIDIFDVILTSDLVVALRTSSIIPALLSKIPVILINYYPLYSTFISGIDDFVYSTVDSPSQLTCQLASFFNDEENIREKLIAAESFAKKYAPYTDSTRRVIDVIFTLINEPLE